MPASSSRPMDGRATFTTVMSSPTMKRLRQQMSRMPVLRRADSCSSITIMKVSRTAAKRNLAAIPQRALLVEREQPPPLALRLPHEDVHVDDAANVGKHAQRL